MSKDQLDFVKDSDKSISKDLSELWGDDEFEDLGDGYDFNDSKENNDLNGKTLVPLDNNLLKENNETKYVADNNLKNAISENKDDDSEELDKNIDYPQCWEDVDLENDHKLINLNKNIKESNKNFLGKEEIICDILKNMINNTTYNYEKNNYNYDQKILLLPLFNKLAHFSHDITFNYFFHITILLLENMVIYTRKILDFADTNIYYKYNKKNRSSNNFSIISYNFSNNPIDSISCNSISSNNFSNSSGNSFFCSSSNSSLSNSSNSHRFNSLYNSNNFASSSSSTNCLLNSNSTSKSLSTTCSSSSVSKTPLDPYNLNPSITKMTEKTFNIIKTVLCKFFCINTFDKKNMELFKNKSHYINYISLYEKDEQKICDIYDYCVNLIDILRNIFMEFDDFLSPLSHNHSEYVYRLKNIFDNKYVKSTKILSPNISDIYKD